MQQSEEKQVRAVLRIRGRVQGVYYRASTVHEAQRLGLSGWVTNCADGSVEAVVEGTRDDVEKLIAWSRRGPDGARVDKLEVEWLEATREFSSFRTRR